MFWKLNKCLHCIGYTVLEFKLRNGHSGVNLANFSLFASIAFAKKPYCKFDFFEKNMTCISKLSRVVSLCYKHITAVKFMNLVHGQMPVFTGGKATFKFVRKIQGHYRQFYRFMDECP